MSEGGGEGRKTSRQRAGRPSKSVAVETFHIGVNEVISVRGTPTFHLDLTVHVNFAHYTKKQTKKLVNKEKVFHLRGWLSRIESVL